ncbi:MAG: ABC transporter transmembrane domain-containing protein, partial [Marinomonas sp.]
MTDTASPQKEEVHTSDAPLVRWMWRFYLKPQRARIFAALALMALEGSMLGALSYIIQPMFDRVFIAGEQSAVYWVAGGIALIFTVRALAAFGHRTIMAGAGLRIVTSMQKDMVRHLMVLDSAYFQSNPPGTLIERVRGDTAAANTIWATVLAAAGRDTVSLIALLAVAVSVDLVWTLVALAGVPLLLGPVLVLQRYVRKSATGARVQAAKLSTRLDEIFHGVNTIKLNTSEARENDRLGSTVQDYLKQE